MSYLGSLPLGEGWGGAALLCNHVAPYTIDEIFAGDIDGFLTQEAVVFDDVRTIFDQQFARLSPLEQDLLFWLAVERVPTSLAQLRQNLLHGSAQRSIVEALRGLQRRTLIERSAAGFELPHWCAFF